MRVRFSRIRGDVTIKMTSPHLIWIALFLITSAVSTKAAQNLSCYQCIKNANEECGEETLLPCAPIKDRCVTTISKDNHNGFQIKRECGLGPCSFDDAMTNKGLGLDGCDRSKDEYFCVFCCRSSGCNKSKASNIKTISFLLLTASIIFVNLIRFNIPS